MFVKLNKISYIFNYLFISLFRIFFNIWNKYKYTNRPFTNSIESLFLVSKSWKSKKNKMAAIQKSLKFTTCTIWNSRPWNLIEKNEWCWKSKAIRIPNWNIVTFGHVEIICITFCWVKQERNTREMKRWKDWKKK